MYKALKSIAVLFLLFFFFYIHIGHSSKETIIKELRNNNVVFGLSESQQLYVDMHLDGVIDFNIFDKAYTGYKSLDARRKNILSIIDFTLPSTEKRLFVLDIHNKEILFSSYVSHGRNSGELYATAFSNRHGSYQSSLGFYETGGVYNGANGYSLILDGLEKGINDQAKPRAIVMHGADYCSQAVIASSGRLGRSLGCPSVPRELAKPIINTIKGGSLLFIYANDVAYLAGSQVFPDDYLAQVIDSVNRGGTFLHLRS